MSAEIIVAAALASCAGYTARRGASLILRALRHGDDPSASLELVRGIRGGVLAVAFGALAGGILFTQAWLLVFGMVFLAEELYETGMVALALRHDGRAVAERQPDCHRPECPERPRGELAGRGWSGRPGYARMSGAEGGTRTPTPLRALDPEGISLGPVTPRPSVTRRPLNAGLSFALPGSRRAMLCGRGHSRGHSRPTHLGPALCTRAQVGRLPVRRRSCSASRATASSTGNILSPMRSAWRGSWPGAYRERSQSGGGEQGDLLALRG